MTFSLAWLPSVLTDAGLKVAECPGWETRGHRDMGTVSGVLCHHTATPGHNGNMPTLNTLINGRSDLPGPLSQLGLGRDGTFYIIAAGLCHHAGRGSWQGITTGNSSFIGIEVENSGAESWPDIQLDACQHGVAAILKHIRKGAEFCAGHKEYALPHGRKSDPNLDMHQFRKDVNDILLKGPRIVPIPSVEPLVTGLTSVQRPTIRRGDNNDPAFVKQIQEQLGLKPDGVFGPKTEAAVRAFQRTKGAVPDGIVGPKTWASLDQVRAGSIASR